MLLDFFFLRPPDSELFHSAFRVRYKCSLGGPQPYVPVAGYEEEDTLTNRMNNIELGVNAGYHRARVLCSYDAKDGTELNLTSNEVCIKLQLGCSTLHSSNFAFMMHLSIDRR